LTGPTTTFVKDYVYTAFLSNDAQKYYIYET